MSDTGDSRSAALKLCNPLAHARLQCTLIYRSYSWRTPRGSTQNQNRQSGQHHRQTSSRDRSSSSQTLGRQGGGSQGLSAMSGNAWPGERTNRDGTSYGPTQEQHIPVRSFNAKETREELLRGMAYQIRAFAPHISSGCGKYHESFS